MISVAEYRIQVNDSSLSVCASGWQYWMQVGALAPTHVQFAILFFLPTKWDAASMGNRSNPLFIPMCRQ